MRRVEAPYPVTFVTPARVCVQYGQPASSRLNHTEREGPPQNSAGLGAGNRMGSHARIFLLLGARAECGVAYFCLGLERLNPSDFGNFFIRTSELALSNWTQGTLRSANSAPGPTPHQFAPGTQCEVGAYRRLCPGFAETPLPKIELGANGGPHAVRSPCSLKSLSHPSQPRA